MKLFLKALLCLAFSAAAFAQCGASGLLIYNPISGQFDCTASGSAAPTGAAGGVLGGSYPNPTFNGGSSFNADATTFLNGAGAFTSPIGTPVHQTFSNVASVAITMTGVAADSLVTCYDTTVSPARLFIPDSVVVTDANTVTANFIPNATGYCNVTATIGPTGATGPTGPSATPGTPVNSVQFNSPLGTFAGDANFTWDNTTKALSLGSGLTLLHALNGNVQTPLGGFGVFQNFLKQSDCFDCNGWTATNVDINDVGLTLPYGEVLATLQGDNDLTSTVAGGNVKQCYDTGTAVDSRTFGLSIYLMVPATPVTARLIISSNTPTTAVTQTVSVTTTWQRFLVSGTFGVDAGTQVCATIVPVDGGTGTVYASTAVLEESTAEYPDLPGLPFNTQVLNSPKRNYGWALGMGSGPHDPSFNIGANQFNQAVNDTPTMAVGRRNVMESERFGAVALGESNVVRVNGQFAIGQATEASGDRSGVIGQGIKNDVDGSLCLSMETGFTPAGLASTGGCSILIRPGGATTPGSVEISGALKLNGDIVNPLQILKNTQAATAPGAGFCDLRWIAGTNSGTGKLVAACGTSATEVTIVDNVGAAF